MVLGKRLSERRMMRAFRIIRGCVMNSRLGVNGDVVMNRFEEESVPSQKPLFRSLPFQYRPDTWTSISHLIVSDK